MKALVFAAIAALSGAARGVVDMKKLMPSFPGLVVSGVIVKDGELLLKASAP